MLNSSWPACPVCCQLAPKGGARITLEAKIIARRSPAARILWRRVRSAAAGRREWRLSPRRCASKWLHPRLWRGGGEPALAPPLQGHCCD